VKHGSLHHSVALPCDSIDDGFSPDGLCETDIDALLAESGVDVDDLDETADYEPAPIVLLRDDAVIPITMPTGGQAA
jgi:hypothetical protein